MITLEEIKSMVSRQLFAQGEEYYEAGAVLGLTEDAPGEWTATVEGTEDYAVEVSIEGDEVTSWYCDCPHQGDICKHVVATLLAIRDREKDSKNDFPSDETEAEEAVDPEEIRKLADACRSREDIQQLLSFTNPQELSRFVCDYASEHSDFKAALLDRFLAKELAAKSKEKDYKEAVKKAFANHIHKSYRHANTWDYDWATVFGRLDILLKKASFFLDTERMGYVIAIALQTLRSIGENYDEALLYNDDDLYVSDYCDQAGDLLIKVAKHPATTRAQKMEMLQELKQIAQIPAYRDYDIYETDELMIQINLLAQSADKALELLDGLLEERKDTHDLYQVVLRKVELLQEQHEEQKAADTICQYLYLPEIRKEEAARLIDNSQYEEAIRLLDEGIEIAKGQGNTGMMTDWLKTKLEIYEATHRVSEVVDTCRLLFISGRDRMEYYDRLKRMVAPTQWKEFLDAMMQETDFATDYSYGESDEAEIYVKEKDYERLYQLLSSIKHGQLQALMKYSHHLKSTHSELLVPLYTSLLDEYAEYNLGRVHYELLVKALACLQKLNGGRKTVQQLISTYRMKYRRRPAMMEILNRQFGKKKLE